MITFFEQFNTNKISTPYTSNAEYLQDYINLQNIKLNEYLKYFEKREVSITPFDKYKGLVISKEEIHDIMKNLSSNFKFGQDLRELEESLKIYIDSRAEASIKHGIYLPFLYLSMVFELNELEKECLILSIMPHMDKQYEKIFAYLQDDVRLKYPTFDLCVKLHNRYDDLNPVEVYFAIKKRILKYFFIKTDKLDGGILSTPLRLNNRILKFIFEHGTSEFREDYFYNYNPSDNLPPVILNFRQITEAQQLLKSIIFNTNERPVELIKQKPPRGEKSSLICINGAEGSGKRYTVKKIAEYFNKNVIFVNTEEVISEQDEFTARLDIIYREALLQQAFICFYNMKNARKENNGLIDKLFSSLRDFRVIFALTEEHWCYRSKPVEFNTYNISLNSPTKPERAELWKHYSVGIKFANVNFEELSDKFDITPGKIAGAIQEAVRSYEMNGTPIDQDTLYRCCYNQTITRLKDKASLVYPIHTLDDLILPDEIKNQIVQAINHVKYKSQVYDVWGFDKKLSYGKGLNVLFTGPPGTGKTMAAQIIAKELKIEMYKIDLSRIISKYIGETEQNLNEVFNEAKKSNVVLFFDETDALFGKRSEVKDSHDKYANIETSFLLQKIEEYNGIVIMATNYIQNIDEAFMRRINMIIHFPFPSPEYRTILWQRIFPKETPITDIDYEYLGNQFELTGGNIKNIALAASFLGVKDGHVGMFHILTALRTELSKQGKTLLREDFGQYYYLL